MKILFFLLLFHGWFVEWIEPWGEMKMFVEITDTLSWSSINQDSVRMFLDDGFSMISVNSTTKDTIVWRNPAITVPEILWNTGFVLDTNCIYDSLLHIIVLNKFILTDIKNDFNLLSKFELYQNYPNPFNPTTTIEFFIPKAENVKLVVYDIRGRIIEILVNSYMNVGNYSVIFDGNDLSSGTYFYILITDKYKLIKKMNLLK